MRENPLDLCIDEDNLALLITTTIASGAASSNPRNFCSACLRSVISRLTFEKPVRWPALSDSAACRHPHPPDRMRKIGRALSNVRSRGSEP